MKQKDLAIILAAIGFSSIFAFVLCNKFIVVKQGDQKAEVVAAITPEFQLPDKTIFNPDAVNPTKVIQIGPNTNNQPFANE